MVASSRSSLRRGSRGRAPRAASAARAAAGRGFVFESLFAPRQAGDLLADRVEAIVAPEIGRIDAALSGAFGDHFVEPFAKIEPGPTGGLLRERASRALRP